jgi:hypothetical protein
VSHRLARTTGCREQVAEGMTKAEAEGLVMTGIKPRPAAGTNGLYLGARESRDGIETSESRCGRERDDLCWEGCGRR